MGASENHQDQTIDQPIKHEDAIMNSSSPAPEAPEDAIMNSTSPAPEDASMNSTSPEADKTIKYISTIIIPTEP